MTYFISTKRNYMGKVFEISVNSMKVVSTWNRIITIKV